MHDILWQAYARHLQASALPPVWWKQWAVRQYRAAEQAAWSKFDALIAINAEEQTYVRNLLADRVPVFYAPMGIDLEQWPYCWTPSDPPRIAYYGGLGNPHRQRDALHCYEALMPPIWRRFPAAQLWLVGSDPPAALFELTRREPRVRVTGFVEKVQEVLKTMTLLLCPWSGTYGFRSRLIEVLALGVPVVASAEAAYGMELSSGQGIFLVQSDAQLAQTCIDLLSDPALLRSQSRLARNQVQERFNFDATYGRLARDLNQFARDRAARRVGLSWAG
jgi:glycosyltransferase involved in cell wall biosynthesis